MSKHRRRNGQARRRNGRYRPERASGRSRTPPSAAVAERCSGCAFTEGTAANLQPLTLVKALLCARALIPFYCHGFMTTGPDGVARLLDENRQLCRGWLDAMDAARRRGEIDNDSPEQRAQLVGNVRLVLELEDRLLAGEPVDEMDLPAEVRQLLPRALAGGR